MLAVENVCRLPAPPESVWPFYTEPRHWTRWSSDIERAEAADPLHVGTTGRCKYQLLPEGTFQIITLDAPHSFILDWTTLATRIRFEHELRPVGAHATRVTERISFHGWLAPILGLLERPRIRTHWPRAMDSLGALALESYRRRESAHHRHEPISQPAEPGPGW